MKSLSLLAVALAIAIPAAPSAAMVARSGDRVTVDADEVIDDDLLATGMSVDIKGQVTGDVIAFAQTVMITGPVGGSVMAAARTVTIEGPVEGSVRAAGESVRYRAPVGHNVLSAGSTIDVEEGCQIGRDAHLAGNFCRFAGSARALTAAANNLAIEDGIAGDVVAYVESLELKPTAKVGGDLVYTSKREAEIDPSLVAGRIQHKLPKEPPKRRGGRPWKMLFVLASGFVTGLVLVVTMPRISRSVAEAPLLRPGASLGWGALVFAATPVLAIIVCVTIVGLPLGLIALVSWGIALYIGYVFAAMSVGRALLGWARRRRRVSLVWGLLLGLVVLILLRMIPFIGGFLILVAIVWGIGSMVTQLRPGPQPAAAAPPPTAPMEEPT
ncbi:hypothetical protein AMK68_04255 [candidate division KD3-62 bacterium DG_56]|uniref:DUF8173 domain-containing protein n=1 Tax=candidate division KD3-62 bacterium DG_56 TaxID=1704032 RepID=A0A0S7XMD9_9BACT|nr:MAG: hypothetical protein AMK68_04255 [candidate division KD3-62 bacterium DG_56]